MGRNTTNFVLVTGPRHYQRFILFSVVQSPVQITTWCTKNTLFERTGVLGFYSPKECHVVWRCHRKIEKNLEIMVTTKQNFFGDLNFKLQDFWLTFSLKPRNSSEV